MQKLKTALGWLGISAVLLLVATWFWQGKGNVTCFDSRAGETCASGGAAALLALVLAGLSLTAGWSEVFPKKEDLPSREETQRRDAEADLKAEESTNRNWAFETSDGIPIPVPKPASEAINPRYRRIDDFFSMADVVLDDELYSAKKHAIERLRAEYGYAAERERA